MTMLALGLWLLQVVPGLEDYPRLSDDVQAHYASSYDRTGGNDDGFEGTYSALYVDARGEHVLVDARGPGALLTLWFTSRVNGRSPLGFGRIKFYFDDEDEPRLDVDADELFSGSLPPFAPPFAFHAFQSTGGYVSYLPMPFAERLKVTTEERVGFYNAYYVTYRAGRAVSSWTGEQDLSGLERAWSRPGSDPKPPTSVERISGRTSLPPPAMPDGEPVPSSAVLFERSGSEVVTALRFNPLFPLTAYQLQHVVLRAYWDDESEPSIEAPLGSFFGSGLGEAAVRAVPLGMSPSGPYYCYLPMPYWRGARFELTNENPEPLPEIWWEAEIADNAYPEADTGRFHARYRRQWPTVEGEDYVIADVSGRGLYLGQVMTVEPLRPELKRWWEGDLRVYLDGRGYPSFHGTGHEDEYLGGWSNEWLMNPYSLPMHGEPKTTELRQVDFQWSAATTVYRFFAAGIPFGNGIRVTTEHGPSNTATAMYSSVAYYYGRPERMERIDAVAADDVRREPGRARFRLRAGPSAHALRLRRHYDPSRRQLAEVWVNGELAGRWYDAETHAPAERVESDFLLPSRAAVGAGELEVELRYDGDSWSATGYELWGRRGP